ncbi:MAG TPA: fused MFS/spermidine synthase [Bryobacteraceae bacterium]|nr:fused MFS/spermidine synthase [Bryobacteraceae bacterium]
MLLYAVTILVSAFLLFQVQPIIAKIILPWFGGSAAVWTTCLLFFQMVLLLGYLYAHAVIRYLKPRTQMILHAVLLVVSAAALPIYPKLSWKPSGTEEPTLAILLLLAMSVGLPYFLLSTTGPLLQAWYARSFKGSMPYRLYALSNAGSMFALISYPVLFEPKMTTHQQAWMWSIAYGVFVAVCGLTAFRSGTVPLVEDTSAEGTAEHPGLRQYVLWVSLPACASVLLLAITNHLSQNVAAIPFLWVLPLSIYLLTFILCFEGSGWYRRNPYLPLLAVALAAMAFADTVDATGNVPIKVLVPLFAMGLFTCCMVCHGELARLKPHPKYLTHFYLMISAGGAVGGLLVGLVAPHVFDALYELQIGLAACGLLTIIVLSETADTEPPALTLTTAAMIRILATFLATGVLSLIQIYRHDSLPVRLQNTPLGLIFLVLSLAQLLPYLPMDWFPKLLDFPRLSIGVGVLVLAGGLVSARRGGLESDATKLMTLFVKNWSEPENFTIYVVVAVLTIAAALILAVLYMVQLRGKWLAFCAQLVVLVLIGYLTFQVRNLTGGYRISVRNFYGALRVRDSGPPTDFDATRTLTHGTINHGEQFLNPARRDRATTYYGPNTGVGVAIQDKQKKGAIRVGVIGLGTGTISSYGRPGDYYRFYEINPLVLRLSHDGWFTFLSDCKAKLDVAMGDARLSLEREADENFDVLAVDAFSSDSIPVHLLTLEAIQLFYRHLRPDGILAIHISNRYLDLEPVLAGLTAATNHVARVVDTEDDPTEDVFGATWVLITSPANGFDQTVTERSAPIEARRTVRLWTDDYSNLFQILK